MPSTRDARIFVFVAAFIFISSSIFAKTIPLNGDWQFVADPARVLTVETAAHASDARTARVPGSWQAEFPDLRDYAGVAWYWRKVQVDTLPAGSVGLLHFGAVDYITDVYVNG